MTGSASTVRLLDVEPDIARFLAAEERLAAGTLTLPVRDVPKGSVELSGELRKAGAFGALVLDGMLVHRLRIGDRPTFSVLGPGDIFSLTGGARSMLLAESGYDATAWTRLALLGDELLKAVQRWPRLAAGIYVRMAEQTDRLSAQLAICQLPRVDQRILSVLWLLAESWGHVRSAGTTLPVSLTHDALGALVGARRPTITLALSELSERGAIVRQGRGWLLLEPAPVPAIAEPTVERPSPIPGFSSTWAVPRQRSFVPARREELMVTLSVLRQEHDRNRERLGRQLAAMASVRERCAEARRRIAEQVVAQRRVTPPAPS